MKYQNPNSMVIRKVKANGLLIDKGIEPIVKVRRKYNKNKKHLFGASRKCSVLAGEIQINLHLI